MKRFVFTHTAINASVEMIPPNTQVAKWERLAFAPFPLFQFACPELGWEIEAEQQDDGSFVVLFVLTKSANYDPQTTYVMWVRFADGLIKTQTVTKDHQVNADLSRLKAVAADDKNGKALVALFFRTLAFLNCPKLVETREVSMAKVNKKRAGTGKPLLPDYIDVRPSALVKSYTAWLKEDRAQVGEHMVRAHWQIYWCGPKDQPQRPEPRLRAPFKRGDPDNPLPEKEYRVSSENSA